MVNSWFDAVAERRKSITFHWLLPRKLLALVVAVIKYVVSMSCLLLRWWDKSVSLAAFGGARDRHQA